MRRIAIVVAVMGLAGCQTVKQMPADYVITPHGLMHRSCVRQVQPGERVHALGHILRADGTREELRRCEHPRLDSRTFSPVPSGSSAINGWVEYAMAQTTTPLGYLTTTWPVPAAPSAGGAVIFFFPGAEPSDGSTVLQPVLQYGVSSAGGGNYWAAASWYCCPSGWSHYSPLINVSTGDTIAGTMSSTCSGGTCDWTITTTDQTTGQTSTLPAAGVTTPFIYNYGAVLEAHLLTNCNQYPATGTTTFSNLVLKDQNGNPIAPNWQGSVMNVQPRCSYKVTNSGATSVTITY